MEILETESDWSDLMYKIKGIKTWFVNGNEDPSYDMATIAEYRQAYPWIDIEVIQDAGQMLIYQHFDKIIPRIAIAAHCANQGRS